MQDRTTPESTTAGLARRSLRRIALAGASAFAAVALVASLATAPQPHEAPTADTADTTELIAGPSWGFTAPEGDIKPSFPKSARGSWGPSWG